MKKESKPFYKGNGNHNILQLESLCNDFKSFTEAQQLKIQELETKLEQQSFNNKHNLSIDQKVSDKIEELKKELVNKTYDLRIAKIHKEESLIRIIDESPYILVRNNKNQLVWNETIIDPLRTKRYRPVSIEDAISRGFRVY